MNRIYRAKRIITMNPARPEATHVAVRDGRIVMAGSLEELASAGEYTLDERFADNILMPGLVEGHAHAMEGTLWSYIYVGYFDRVDPDGNVWPGATTIEAVIERLKSAEQGLSDPVAPLSGWSLDAIYFGNRRVNRHDLDQASTTRAIGVLNASGHILNVNSKALELAGLLRHGINHPGIPLGEDGLPTGELLGPDAMLPLGPHTGFDRDLLACDELGMRKFAKLCVRKGVTTAADLANLLPQDAVEMMLRVTSEQDYPARIVSLRRLQNMAIPDLIERAKELRDMSTDLLRLGAIKLVADGSIQGFTARLRWPHYHNGAPNGLWYTAPEQLTEAYRLGLKEGLLIHTHTNGDEATELVLDCLETALRDQPAFDHRYTLQHCQLADAALFRRIKKLGMCVNLFPNHHYYWGDEHYRLTVGPERAERMNACATALANGVPMAIHSDAPVTPLGPFFTAWCAINRQTASGRTLGEYEKITLDQALYAITLGAAYTLKLDGEIGSIECGKRADFTVLEADPYELGGEDLKDMPIWGTVQGGRVFAASAQ